MRHWFLVTNKSVWDLATASSGHVEPFGLCDAKGKRRRCQLAFDEIEKGDVLWGYIGGSDGGVVAQMSCVAPKHLGRYSGREEIDIRKEKTVAHQVRFSDLKDDSVLSNSAPMRCGCRGTLFEITADEFERIETLTMVG